MHVMIDIETLSPEDDGRIVQIGAVAFELNGTICEPHELMQFEDRWLNLPIIKYDGHCDPKTVAWWADPDQTVARQSITDAKPWYEIGTALKALDKFCKQWLGKRGKVWAMPPMFDLRILRGNYKAHGGLVPWHYSQEFDLRTLLWLAAKVPPEKVKGPDLSKAGLIDHNALHDAAGQAVLAQAAFRGLALNRPAVHVTPWG